MAKNTLLATQNITTTPIQLSASLSVYGVSFFPTPFKFEVGETYTVVWNGTEYTCEAYDGSAFIDGTTYVGNASSFGLQGDPTLEFIITSNDAAVGVMSLVDTMAGTSGTHSVGVYYEDTEYKIFGHTLKAIANSIRSKTGSKDKMSPTDMSTAIDNISGGGGGSAEGCVTMTFMNGDTVLFTRPVYIGDNCPDPITQGHIKNKPTKDPTVDKVFTYDNGWSLTDGGSKDDNALKNVTADRTVWAAYSSTPREYTITFYDDDGVTVLNTMQVAYGTVPRYTPTKEGVGFAGWTPTPVPVTGDASYTATWVSVLATGGCGTKATWSLSADYVLTISGTGAMLNWTSNNKTGVAWRTTSYIDKIQSVIIEDGITSIGDYAFNSCTAITSVTIPNTVTSIGLYAFNSCKALTSVTIPNTVTSISKNAFANCHALPSITIPNTVTSIGEYAFDGCIGLQSITIPNSVTNISAGTFRSCYALTSVTIPNTVTSIGLYAFKNCNALTSVTIPASVTSISYGALDCSGLTSVTFDDPDGWYVTQTEGATSGTTLTLTSKSTNATYLKNTYRYYYWYNT